MAVPPPLRLSLEVREAILRRLARHHRSSAVPVSQLLRDVRSEIPTLRDTDEELIQQIVIDATDHGYAVHFDGEDDRN